MSASMHIIFLNCALEDWSCETGDLSLGGCAVRIHPDCLDRNSIKEKKVLREE